MDDRFAINCFKLLSFDIFEAVVNNNGSLNKFSLFFTK